MFNVKSLCSAGMVLVLASATFAEFNITTSKAMTAGGATTTDYTATIANPNVTLSNTTTPSLGGAAAIAAYGTTPGTDGYFVAETTVSNNGGNSLVGLIGNFNTTTNSGYYFDFNFQNGNAYITRVDNNVGTAITTSTSSYSTSDSYILQFRYDGGITCNLYDSNRNFLETLVSSDTTYTSGVTGVMAYTTLGWGGLDSTKGSFANYNVVPEPVTVLLLGAGALGMYIKRKRG